MKRWNVRGESHGKMSCRWHRTGVTGSCLFRIHVFGRHLRGPSSGTESSSFGCRLENGNEDKTMRHATTWPRAACIAFPSQSIDQTATVAPPNKNRNRVQSATRTAGAKQDAPLFQGASGSCSSAAESQRATFVTATHARPRDDTSTARDNTTSASLPLRGPQPGCPPAPSLRRG